MKSILQAISGRLCTLKKKFGAASFRKVGALIHAWFYRVILWFKEFIALHSGLSLSDILQGLRKSGVLASLTILALFMFMGHSATVAWLTYTTPVARNVFHVGRMNLTVDYRSGKMTDFAPLEGTTSLFNDEALYEPGYTQVVYFRVTNTGDIPFDYNINVRDVDSIDSENVYGGNLHLPDYLYFGMTTAPTQQELLNQLSTRAAAQHWAQELAVDKLGTYSKQGSQLAPGETDYAALVVYMPWYVGNEANHAGRAPQVIMGVSVNAQQAGTME